MEINRKTLFLFDFCFFIGIIVGIILLIIIDFVLNFNISILGIGKFVIIYIFIRSICGGILLTRAIIIKEIIVTKKTILTLFNILYIILNICILIFESYFFINYRQNESTFTDIGLFIISIVNLCINMIGVPMWNIYIFSQNNFNSILKKMYILLTVMIITFLNFVFIYGILLD